MYKKQSEKFPTMSDVPSSSGQNGFFSEHILPPPRPTLSQLWQICLWISVLDPSPPPHPPTQKLRFRFETDLLGAQRAN
jgi:hypothetical protein